MTNSVPVVPLDKLCRFLNSVRGTDKVLMLVQYASKIIIWHLKRRAPSGASALATKVSNLAGPVSDFRILLRYYGLIPLLQWILVFESDPPSNVILALLGRLQNLANLCYYPLEHVYWLALHKVIDMSDATRDKIGMWSCRFWAVYVVLYFGQMAEEYRLLRQREVKLLRKGNDAAKGDTMRAIVKEKVSLGLNAVINAAYFPLTIHWSLESSSFPDVGVGICGTIAALIQFYTAWRST